MSFQFLNLKMIVSTNNMALTNDPTDLQSKVFNLNNNEWQLLSFYLSSDPKIRSDQINFLNNSGKITYKANKTPINRSIAASNSRISPDDVAKSIYDLKKIDSLQKTVAKATIGATGFLDKQIDTLGATIINQIDKLTNWAEQGVNQMESTLQDWGASAAAAERKFLDKTIYPCTSWVGDTLKGMSTEFVSDLHEFNKHISQSRLLNAPGDAFNSIRHIAYAIKGEIEKLIDFTHQIFAGITAAILKLKRLVRRAVKAIVVFLVTLIENLIPTQLLTDIGQAVNGLLGGLQGTFSSFFNNLGLSAQEGIFKGLMEEITKMTAHPLLYILDQLGADVFVNLPIGNWSQQLKAIENDIVNNQLFTQFLNFSNKFTLEYLISKLPPGAQQTIKILSQISSNAHGFIGNGIRNYARTKILKNKNGIFLGKLQSVGISFNLSASYHYSSGSSQRVAPILTFRPLLTDGTAPITTDKYGNKVITSYTETHLF